MFHQLNESLKNTFWNVPSMIETFHQQLSQGDSDMFRQLNKSLKNTTWHLESMIETFKAKLFIVITSYVLGYVLAFWL